MYELLLLSLFSFLVTSCQAGAPGGGPETTSASQEQTAATAGLLLEYQRSGGFAGLDDRLLVYGDGRASLTRRGGPATETVLEPATLEELRAALEAAQFCALPETALPARSGADRFTYVVTSYGCDPPHSVTTADGAVPGAMAPLLDLLGQIVGRLS